MTLEYCVSRRIPPMAPLFNDVLERPLRLQRPSTKRRAKSGTLPARATLAGSPFCMGGHCAKTAWLLLAEGLLAATKVNVIGDE